MATSLAPAAAGFVPTSRHGPVRARLFREGGLTVERFAELQSRNFAPLTLVQMKAAAGLDEQDLTETFNRRLRVVFIARKAGETYQGVHQRGRRKRNRPEKPIIKAAIVTAVEAIRFRFEKLRIRNCWVS